MAAREASELRYADQVSNGRRISARCGLASEDEVPEALHGNRQTRAGTRLLEPIPEVELVMLGKGGERWTVPIQKIVEVPDGVPRPAGDLYQEHLVRDEIRVTMQVESDIGDFPQSLAVSGDPGVEQRVAVVALLVPPWELVEMRFDGRSKILDTTIVGQYREPHLASSTLAHEVVRRKLPDGIVREERNHCLNDDPLFLSKSTDVCVPIDDPAQQGLGRHVKEWCPGWGGRSRSRPDRGETHPSVGPSWSYEECAPLHRDGPCPTVTWGAGIGWKLPGKQGIGRRCVRLTGG